MPIAKTAEEAIFNLEMSKVNGVVCENTSGYDIDIGAQRAAAVHNLAQQIENPKQHGNDIPIVDEYEITSGNVMIEYDELVYQISSCV